MKKVLLVLDMQNDFFKEEESKLPIPSAETIIDPINNIVQAFYDKGHMVMFLKDWHPTRHSSFRKIGEHCIKNSPGARIHPKVVIPRGAITLTKDDDSAFFATDGYFGLHSLLQDEDIGEVFVVGLTLDGSVGETCIDALRYNYKVTLVRDLAKARTFTGYKATLAQLGSTPVDITTSDKVLQALTQETL